MYPTVLSLLAAFGVFSASAQQPIPANMVGTWASGSRNVQTGPNFVNPIAYTFNYPKTTGISYSFTQDGYFEEALYRFTTNATNPGCVQGAIIWQHGKFEISNNGSLILHPYPEDGRIQVQDRCAASSSYIAQFNQTTLFKTFQIFTDPVDGLKLHIFRWDGAPFPPMFLVANPPNMLPTRSLVGQVTGTNSTIDMKKRWWLF